MRFMLRDFIYLDQRIVNQFLAQLEGGLFDQETERRSLTGKSGFGVGVHAPVVNARADKGRERTTEAERTTRQTPESQFNRLYDYLEKDELISLGEVDDKTFVDGLKRGQLLDFEDTTVEVSGFYQAAAYAKQLSGLLPLVELFGADVDIDQKSRAGMQAVGALANEEGPLPVIARAPGSAKLAIAMDLHRSFLLDAVAGEASLLVRVVKVLRRGQTHLVGDPTDGVASHACRADRRKLTSGFDKKAQSLGLNNPQIGYPGIVGTAIAIYR